MASKISGFNELKQVLRELPPLVQDKVMADAVRAGTNIVYKEVEKSAPVNKERRSLASLKYGRLKANIRMFKLKFNVPDGKVIFRVNTGNAFWGNFIEKGTRYITAKPWFRPAWDKTRNRAADKILRRLASGIESAAAKLARKNGL